MFSTLRLTEQLISRNSVTPDGAGCQRIIFERLQALGFVCETTVEGPEHFRVTNLWAKFKGFSPLAQVKPAPDAINSIANCKILVFAGHTDVVPTGPLDQWHSHPFTPSHRDGVLYVRGAIQAETGINTELSTTGGTSDGRFIAKVCREVVEFGPINASIHKINEHVLVSSLDPLKNIYKGIFERLAGLTDTPAA